MKTWFSTPQTTYYLTLLCARISFSCATGWLAVHPDWGLDECSHRRDQSITAHQETRSTPWKHRLPLLSGRRQLGLCACGVRSRIYMAAFMQLQTLSVCLSGFLAQYLRGWWSLILKQEATKFKRSNVSGKRTQSLVERTSSETESLCCDTIFMYCRYMKYIHRWITVTLRIGGVFQWSNLSCYSACICKTFKVVLSDRSKLRLQGSFLFRYLFFGFLHMLQADAWWADETR